MISDNVTPDILADQLLAASPDVRRPAVPSELGLDTIAALKIRVDATKLRNARRALEIAEVAVATAALLADPAAEGLALWARGNALYHLSRYREALECYRRAETFYAGGHFPLEVARLQINQVAVLQDLGTFGEALAVAAQARDACARIGEPARRFLALLEMNSGAAYQQLARPAEALAAYDRGRAIFVALGDPVEAARMDINRANVLQEQGQFAEAEALYRGARDALLAAGIDQEVCRAEHNIGKLAFRRGRYQEALTHLEAARAGYAAIPNPLEVAKADLYRAMVSQALGLHEEAAALAAEAGAVFARARTRWEQATALMVEGTSLARLDRPEASAPLLDRARRLLRRQGALERIPALDAERAALALACGAPKTARRLAARVARDTDPVTWPSLAARALTTLAEAQLALGRLGPAALSAAEAAQLAVRYELPEGPAAYHVLARYRTADGSTRQAWEALRLGVGAAEALRARLPLDDLRLAFLDAHRSLYADAAALALRHQPPAVALAAVELVLSAPLPRPTLPPGDPAVSNELHRLREQWAYVESALGEPGNQSGAALDRQRRELERAIADCTLRLAVSAGVGGAATSGLTLEQGAAEAWLRTLHARLGPGAALLAYWPVGDGIFAFVVTADGLVRRELAARPAAVERLLRSWRFHVEHAYTAGPGPGALAAAHAHLRQLHAALVAPLLDALGGAARLLVALPPEWQELPLGAALGPEGHLVERCALSVVAAPGSLAAARERVPGGPALVVGCSDDGRLPATGAEAAAVAEALAHAGPVRHLVEAEAQRATVLAALGECSVIHLAAHACYRPDSPLFSWVRLADGHLAVADLAGLQLARRPLVVLSACESGRGHPRGGGLVGMARAFLVAGASALIASLWKVADGSTAQLMAELYGNLDEHGSAVALARAQRAAILRGEHPFHWGAFITLEG